MDCRVGALEVATILEDNAPPTTNEIVVTEYATTRFAAKRGHSKEPWIEKYPGDDTADNSGRRTPATKALNERGADKPNKYQRHQQNKLLKDIFNEWWLGAGHLFAALRAVVL